MKTVALTCNNCGAALDVSEDVRFFTCAHCGSRLEVKHTSDTVFTQVLEKVDRVERVAAGTAAEVEIVKIERELEKVEAKLAALKNPGGYGMVVLCWGLAFFGLIMFAASDAPKAKAAGMMNVLVFGVFGALFSWKQPSLIRTYETSLRDLTAERDAIKARLDEATSRALTTRA